MSVFMSFLLCSLRPLHRSLYILVTHFGLLFISFAKVSLEPHHPWSKSLAAFQPKDPTFHFTADLYTQAWRDLRRVVQCVSG